MTTAPAEVMVAGPGGWEEQRAAHPSGAGSSLLLGAAVLLPILLPLLVVWMALPAVSAEGRLLSESLARGGIEGVVAYGMALAQWTLAALFALAVQQWAWVLAGGLGLLVAWVLRRG